MWPDNKPLCSTYDPQFALVNSSRIRNAIDKGVKFSTYLELRLSKCYIVPEGFRKKPMRGSAVPAGGEVFETLPKVRIQ